MLKQAACFRRIQIESPKVIIVLKLLQNKASKWDGGVDLADTYANHIKNYHQKLFFYLKDNGRLGSMAEVFW